MISRNEEPGSMTERGWRLARMEDVPAAAPADDPEFWVPLDE